MKNAITVLGVIAVILIGVYLIQRYTLPISINHPDITIPNIEFKVNRTIFEYSKSRVPALSIYQDKDSNEHQVYSNIGTLINDSIHVEVYDTVNVDVSNKISEWSRKIIAKPYYKEVTTTKRDTVLVPKDMSWYENNWFWIWFLEKLVFIAGIFFGVSL